MLTQEQQDNIKRAIDFWEKDKALDDALPNQRAWDNWSTVLGIPSASLDFVRDHAQNERDMTLKRLKLAEGLRIWLTNNGHGYVLADGSAPVVKLTQEQQDYRVAMAEWLYDMYLTDGDEDTRDDAPNIYMDAKLWSEYTGFPESTWNPVGQDILDHYLAQTTDDDVWHMLHENFCDLCARHSGKVAEVETIHRPKDPQRVVIDELCAWYEGGKTGDMPFMPLDSDWEQRTGLPLSVRKEAAEAFMQNAHSGAKIAGAAYARVLRVAIGQQRPIVAAPITGKVIPEPEPLKPKLNAEKIFEYDHRKRIDTSKIIAS